LSLTGQGQDNPYWLTFRCWLRCAAP
jgi:hypothetical protein